jgi:NAD(P)-dependent dehydrogenase (short-subunit alcohol dehydrogenase family)
MARINRRRLILGGGTIAAATVTTVAMNAQADDHPVAQTNARSGGGRFTNKVVLITGATSGIGEATARAFAKEGAIVHFCGRREALGNKVAQEITDQGGRASYQRADVRSEQDVKAFIDTCVQKYGRIDIAFNNAGIDYPPHPIADTPTAGFDDLMNTNARGVFLGMKYEIPHLLKAGQGAIINTASIGGYRAFPNIVGYGASKAAIIHMTKMAAQEYGKLRINAVLPGAIDTAMLDRVERDWKVTKEQLVQPYPIKRVGKPEEVTAMVLWLASEDASYISGGQFGVDGGGLG